MSDRTLLIMAGVAVALVVLVVAANKASVGAEAV